MAPTPANSVSSNGRGRGKKGLSCAVIVDKAIQIADARGVESLTMRSLASQLGVEAMSLYSHFASKDDLLNAMTARLLFSLELPDRDVSPKRRLVRLADEYRRLGHKHPNIFPMVILRPQRIEASLRTTEYALDALQEAGLTVKPAILAQRTLISFIRGYTLWELGGFATGRRTGPGGTPVGTLLATIEQLDAERFPRVRAAARQLLSFTPDDDFHAGLYLILDMVLPASDGKGGGKSPLRGRRKVQS